MLNDEDIESLEKPITLDEIKIALSLASNNKSPGIDGLPYEFYSSFLDMLGEDLLGVYNNIFKTGTMSMSQRTGIVTLLPKKGDKTDPTNWRPISLLNTDYKLISKVLQIRMSKVLPTIVNEHQTCSVPGRSIHDNMFIIRDIIDYSAMKKIDCALISIDQHKAFDKVSWSFLMRVLEKLRFGSNFRKWVTILYNNIYSRILINGNLSDIYPLLEGIRGFPIPGGSGRRVKFLQYADDATCVATNIGDIAQYFNVFKLFQKATGASVNMSKTCGLKLGTFASRQLPTNIHWSTSSIKITGVTFGSKEAVHCNWATKVKSATLLAKSWSSRHLTLLGKVLVTNTVIYPLFYFVAPVFRVPDSVVKEVNKAVFSFIWGENKPDLVSRKVIILDRLQGGLGLDSFRNKMDALLIRPLFTLLTRMQDPPIHFIIARFFLAMPLRRVFPQLWSNTRPNSAVCPPSLLYASDIIRRLHSMDSLFFQSSKSIKLITKSLQPSGANLIAVRDYPAFPWETIWKLAFSNMLGNKLMDFQWRLASHFVHR
ncbi:reverse transcriptase [Apostichopus japonicus]|uniref:Reverse transcriptase n=1 Tax=Stichopus japonicus TaxID=307972 RepID=A0A2G8JFY2_STIJA|nr:reverse transcriptase [Apostichopus japonicus]